MMPSREASHSFSVGEQSLNQLLVPVRPKQYTVCRVVQANGVPNFSSMTNLRMSSHPRALSQHRFEVFLRSGKSKQCHQSCSTSGSGGAG